MPEIEAKISHKTRSIPRHAYALIRCLHCGNIQSLDGKTLHDKPLTQMLAKMSEHTEATGHKVEVTITESFHVDVLR